MSTTLSTRIKCLAVLALAMAVEGVEAQYGYPYGYRRRRTGGWRNIYLVAILIPIAAFVALWLLWFFIFRAIFRRRRQRASNTVLPTTSNTATGYYPASNEYGNAAASGYGNNSSYGNNEYSNSGAASSYYNNTQPEMSEAYTKHPAQAYHPGQNSYAPPAGAPPNGYDSYGGGNGYAPPAGAPPSGYNK
ncbi:hypothetical protein NCC49_004583 [Naganishia albida]|nr:hypothetical protein NCC49_004583 [Naganishia albida]